MSTRHILDGAAKTPRRKVPFGYKAAVEALDAELRAASPEKFTTPPKGKGCVGVLAICTVILVVLMLIIFH